jgi:hypothetical protein
MFLNGVLGSGVAATIGVEYNGAATSVRLGQPNFLYGNAANKLYLADISNNRVKLLDLTSGQCKFCYLNYLHIW